MSSKGRLIHLFALLLLCCTMLQREASGQYFPPPFYNVSDVDMGGHPQVFKIAQDNRGVIYFGNGQDIGVKYWDGSRFGTVATTYKSFVQCVESDENGRIYVGGRGEFGYLEVDSIGQLVFFPLFQQLQEDYLGFTAIWNIDFVDDKVYFHSHEYIFEWDYETLKVFPAENRWHTTIAANGRLYARDDHIGLKYLENGEMKLAPGGEIFAENRVYDMHQFKGDTMLLISPELGLHFYNHNTPLQGILHLLPFQTELEEYFKISTPFGIECLPDGNFALNTVYKGLVIMSPNGKMVDIIDVRSGLKDDRVWDITQGKNGLLWLSLNRGIAVVDLYAPVREIKSENNFDEFVNSARKVDNNMILGGGSHILRFKYDQNQIRQMMLNPNSEENYNEVVQLYNSLGFLSSYHFGKLLIGSAYFVFKIEGDDITQLTEVGARELRRSRRDTNMVYFAEMTGAGYLYHKDGNFQYEDFPLPEGVDITSQNILEDPNAEEWTFWMNDMDGGVFRVVYDDALSNPKVTFFDTTQGFAIDKSEAYILGGEVIFTSDNKVLLFDEKNQQFVPHPDFKMIKDKNLDSGPLGVEHFFESRNGEIYVIQDSKIFRGNKADSGLHWETDPFLKLDAAKFTSINCDNPDSVIISAVGLLGLYNPNQAYDFKEAFPAVITEVIAGEQKIHGGVHREPNGTYSTHQPSNEIPVLEFSQNKLEFKWSSVYFKNGKKPLEYAYMLEGIDEEWSKWEDKTFIWYNFLPQGQYTMRVKARNIYKVESEEASFSFVILPPWYQTLWAYILYGVGGIFFMWFVVKLNSRRLKRANQRLQETVDEKTAEIRSQKEEIEGQRDDIAKKNKALTDSIVYAKSLQEAILPASEMISTGFIDHVVYFRPRDIVSGDFYWYHEKDDRVFFAAVDCTGHGVPGALVSMTGSNLLQQIIVERDENDPAIILKELNIGVKSVFKRDGSLASANDGMDIALAVYHKDSMKIDFAGAHRSMVIIRDGELQEVKGDRTPIGGRTKPEFEFQSHEFQGENGDWIYMFSDGYPDQFGGPDNRKFMISRFKQLLCEIANTAPEDQVERLEQSLISWQGKNNRIDDILVLGFKVGK